MKQKNVASNSVREEDHQQLHWTVTRSYKKALKKRFFLKTNKKATWKILMFVKKGRYCKVKRKQSNQVWCHGKWPQHHGLCLTQKEHPLGGTVVQPRPICTGQHVRNPSGYGKREEAGNLMLESPYFPQGERENISGRLWWYPGDVRYVHLLVCVPVLQMCMQVIRSSWD